MFARVTRGTSPVDKLDDSIALYQKTLLPSVATRRGFLGAVLLVDRSTGASRSMTFWQDEAAMRESEDMAAEARARMAQQQGARIGEPERYELLVHERVISPRPNVFVRVNDIQGSGDRVEEAVRLAREQILPMLRQQRGWLAMQLMVNRQNGRSIIMSVWDSAANREASEAAVRQQREQFRASLGSIEVSLYDAAVVQFDPAAFPVGGSVSAST
jgi:heme-degrading monooxygenase HmoA